MSVPLFTSANPERPLVWSDGRIVSVGAFMADLDALARQLPDERYLVNLCERRYDFMVAYCAALVRGQTNLLPSSRVSDVVDEVIATHPRSFRCDDELVSRALGRGDPRQLASHARPDAGATRAHADERSLVNASSSGCNVLIPASHIAAIAFTSGSTGTPKAHIKRWGSFQHSSAHNAAAIRRCLEPEFGTARPWVVATVPPQHMYGMETSIILPLVSDMAVHAGRPFFPADVAQALSEVPAPRVLVTAPVHLRALLASGQSFPELALVVCATAPLDIALAIAVEREWKTTILEMFGATETCVIATRLTAREEAWHLHQGVSMEPGRDSARVNAPWFDAPTTMPDVIELLSDGRFVIRGRNVDMIEVAGKRASLTDLTRRLISIPGVEDAVIFQPDSQAGGGVRRVAALVVAPGLTTEAIHDQLTRCMDPVFIPRPLVKVPVLPRNELGKLPRDRLLAALHASEDHSAVRAP